mgnify:CR=1 FL=1
MERTSPETKFTKVSHFISHIEWIIMMDAFSKPDNEVVKTLWKSYSDFYKCDVDKDDQDFIVDYAILQKIHSIISNSYAANFECSTNMDSHNILSNIMALLIDYRLYKFEKDNGITSKCKHNYNICKMLCSKCFKETQ